MTTSGPPNFLPPAIARFLADTTRIPTDQVPLCWDLFKQLVWQPDYAEQLQGDADGAFRRHGIHRGLSTSLCTGSLRRKETDACNSVQLL